ncbi:MAG TPA: endonuclease/exonuclease/phosphatase family protein [Candidatus Angelobacter sp.]|nr:endonuclease/exonuclease/phosphatase family protein [Candidatus Angelobacter sp.]
MLSRGFIVALVCAGQSATLCAFSLLTYNVSGNGTTDWSTNSTQVQAIGREMIHLHPDIITFQEIPFTNSYQMPNFVKAYLPSYFLATNSGTDGFLRSVIASRFPIVRSQKWLDGVSLIPFGYTNSPSTFTRDLFEAEISVPEYPEHVHVFTTHLKAQSDSTSASRRAAEASAISNFFATVFLPTNGSRPYMLTGDLNEDVNRPPSSTRHPIERLVNANTGLHLTTPVNPVTKDDRTISIRATLDARFDYILPGDLLFSNITASEIFRTDLLSPVPPPLQQLDDKTASDHLPVLMTFRDPYAPPFALTSVFVTNGVVALSWEAADGWAYDVEGSSDLSVWTKHATNLIATATNIGWSANANEPVQFFRIFRAP